MPPPSEPSGPRPTGSSCTTSRRCRSTGAASNRSVAARTPSGCATAARWFVERGCQVKGHPLCWHSVGADWLLGAHGRRDRRGAAGADPPRRGGLRRPDRHLGRDQRSRDHADLRQVRQRHLADGAQARPGRHRPGHLRRRARGQPRRDPAAQRLRHVRGLRAPRRGTASRRASGSMRWGSSRTCTRATGARRRPWTSSSGSPASGCPSTSPRAPSCPGTSCRPRSSTSTTTRSTSGRAPPTARPARPTRSSGTTGRCSRTRRSQAITWWGFSDDGWLHAPTGLIRADGTRKPAFDALRGLIRGDWWLPPTPMVTDETRQRPVQRLPRRLRRCRSAGSRRRSASRRRARTRSTCDWGGRASRQG